jgi:hypothetical protein
MWLIFTQWISNNNVEPNYIEGANLLNRGYSEFATLVVSSLKIFMFVLYLKLPSVLRILEKKNIFPRVVFKIPSQASINCHGLSFFIFYVTFNEYVCCHEFCSLLFLMSHEYTVHLIY